ncbi:MAG TPA: 2OG-Fe(II) oxygenase family protein [Acidimicrobiia bacterium]|nr:2OG-Fe(II) oxygenase family protein [Acidimicrobiia bacterium]
MHVPEIDVGPLITGRGDQRGVALEIDAACRETGFFSIVGHGVNAGLRARLDASAREFFELDDGEKAEIAMTRGGRAWRGWFAVGGELTSGVPDLKEGIYFGRELGPDDARVRAGVPLHGPNLFPRRPAALRETVLEYLDALTGVGQAVMRGVALALGLAEDWFARELTSDPTILFRIFRYPPMANEPTAGDTGTWGVREHTDYGLLTVLLQDDTGGLEVRSRSGWLDVQTSPDAFVCNLGDMLELMTGGRYRSTPHRVRNTSDRARLSFPFFFDPGWDSMVRRIPASGAPMPSSPRSSASRASLAGAPRWDGAALHDLTGTYGEYLLAKVAKVFPALGVDVL